jgi:hypothetical protein
VKSDTVWSTRPIDAKTMHVKFLGATVGIGPVRLRSQPLW